MTIRNDVTVNWASSPRIITVASPSETITIKDLYDTLRSLEASLSSMDDDSIVEAGGLEDLGGGVQVGLTVTLLNAKLAFESRSGPAFSQCRISGGNLVAKDSAGTYFSSPIESTAYTQVILSNSSSATLMVTDGSGGSGITAADVWNYLLSNPAAGTAGAQLKKALTTGNFLALKD